MSIIVNSRDTLKNWCLREIGWPVIDPYIDDDQIEDRIDEALEYFREFHVDGTERTYLKHQLTQIDLDNKYIPISSNVASVISVFPASASTSAVNMFDIRYQMRLQDIQSFTTGSISNFWITMTHLRQLEMVLQGEQPIRFNQKTNKLYIDWHWGVDVLPDQYTIIEATVIVDPEVYTEVYNDKMLKQLATQLIKRQWGINMMAYSGVVLPGGITMNGDKIFELADAEVKALKAEIRNTYEAPPMFLVG